MEPPARASMDATCPHCGAALELDERPLIGEVVDCARCAAACEVAAVEPLAIVPFRRVEEEPEDFRDFELP